MRPIKGVSRTMKFRTFLTISFLRIWCSASRSFHDPKKMAMSQSEYSVASDISVKSRLMLEFQGQTYVKRSLDDHLGLIS